MAMLILAFIWIPVQSLTAGSVPQFVAVYTDPSNKLAWSAGSVLQMGNGCENHEGYFDISQCSVSVNASGKRMVDPNDSNAAKECQKVGARLPTREEYKSLVKQFDHIPEGHECNPMLGAGKGPCLTSLGIQAMNAIFKDMGESAEDRFFWTASVSATSDEAAIAFSGNLPVDYLSSREDNLSVRCVKNL